MRIEILKSKLKEVIVTDASNEYDGSLTLDRDLMEAAHLVPYERVEVNSVGGKARIVTYIIEGERGSGQVELNGGAANFFMKGEKIHVNCFAMYEPHEIWEAIIVITDKNNKVTEVK